MKVYTSITEAIDAIPFGYCNWCDAKHEFNNIKCDLDPSLEQESC